MPQEKFITRKQAGIGNTRTGFTTTPSQRAASRITDNEIRQAMFDMVETDRDVRRATAQNAGSKAMRAQRQVGNQSGSSRLIGRAGDALISNQMRDVEPSRSSMDNEKRAASADVTARDAQNARTARQRLASRASRVNLKGAGERPVVDTFDGNKRIKNAPNVGVLGNPMIGVAAAIADADRTTGYKRAKYSGNFGGPSFAVNPYSSKSSYVGQSPMSKMMGVGKKSK